MHETVSGARRLTFWLVSFALVFGICYATLEYGFARYYYSNVDEIIDKEFDPVLGWRYKPGTYHIKPARSVRTHDVSINSLGFRNRDVAKNPRDNTQRVLILGDSFSFGKAVNAEHIFPTQIERMLNANSTDVYEVVNAGVEGYGTAQQLLLLKRLVNEEEVKSDIYVLQIFTNDTLDNLRLNYGSLDLNVRQPGFTLDAAGKLRLEHLPQRTTRSNRSNNDRSTAVMLFKVVRTSVESFFQSRPDLVELANTMGIRVEFPRMPGVINAWYVNDILEPGLLLMKNLVEEIKKEVNGQGGELIAIFIPSPLMIYPDVYGPILQRSFPNNSRVDEWRQDVMRPSKFIRNLFQEVEISLVDMTPIFSEKADQSFYIPREGHLNEAGHALVASSLAQVILELKIPTRERAP